MSQHYTDTSRESETYSLPDVEVWEDTITIIRSRCGEFEVGREAEAARGFCPSCDRATCVESLDTFDGEASGIQHTDRKGWFWWICFPGCLPDSEPHGPYASEQDAIEAMRDACGE